MQVTEQHNYIDTYAILCVLKRLCLNDSMKITVLINSVKDF